MNSVHSLSVIGKEHGPGDKSTERAFNGLLRTFKTTGADGTRHLENFMRAQKPRGASQKNEQQKLFSHSSI